MACGSGKLLASVVSGSNSDIQSDDLSITVIAKASYVLSITYDLKKSALGA